MKKINVLLLSAAAFFITACGSSENKNQHNESEKQVIVLPEAEIELNDKTTEDALMEYLKVKNALTAAEPQQAKQAAEALSKELHAIEGCEPTALIAEEIAQSDSLQVQREKFTILSADMIALMKNADIKTGTIFVQYCPMANEGNGGYWLASQKDIRNPYYGEDMLECGEVKDELKAEK